MRCGYLVLVLLLTGCGGGGGSSPSPEPTRTPEPTPTPTPTTYSIVGSVSGLVGSITISNNGEELVVNESTTFSFTPQLEGILYNIEVTQQPTNQICNISNSTGTLTEDVTSVEVDCQDEQRWSGSQVFGEESFDKPQNIALLPDGRIVMAGFCCAAAQGEIFARHVNGENLWQYRISERTSTLWDVAVDSEGDIYAVGSAQTSVDSEQHSGDRDVLIIKLDKNGKRQWTRLIGGSRGERAFKVAVNENGQIFIGGFVESSPFEGQEFETGTHLFVMALDGTTGATLWTSLLDNEDNTGFFGGLALDADQNVLVSIASRYSADRNIVVYSFDSTGERLWRVAFETEGHEYPNGGIALDSQGNLLVAGSTEAREFYGVTNETPTKTTAFLLKLTPNAEIIWVKLINDPEGSFAWAEAIVGDDDSITLVVESNSWDSPTPEVNSNIFIRQWTAEGDFLWEKEIDTTGVDEPISAIFDLEGNIIIGGETFGTFPGQTNAGFTDNFLLKIDPTAGTLIEGQDE